ncbi:MAG: DUF1684 domain-containing protein [Bacteroidetes bacterium]|nr:DUF1684 domain-containing protein [Bacteroidota bacterium]
MIKRRTTSILIILILFVTGLFNGCDNEPKQNADEEYIKLINEWDNKRIENLKSKTGWLNLAGLYWLKEGENKFGGNNENDIVFPDGKADDFIGSFILNNGQVTLKVNPGVKVYSNNELVTDLIVMPDTSENTTIMDHNNLSWFVIIRDDKVGIRLRDYDSETVKTFNGIDRFPVDTTWRIKAKYIKFETTKIITVPNILGTFSEEESKGEIVFTKNGTTYSLAPIAAGDKYFIIFADETSGIYTYGAGRFLYSNIEDENGNIILDFNKAYNPPCAFSKYATCPIPPKENHLKLSVTAGEKNWGNH